MPGERRYSAKQIGMDDVALAAGVSTATVSRALHSPERVAPATLAKVRGALEQTGYVYNTMAADFTKRRNSLVGLVVFTLRSSIQSDFVDGVQEELERANHSLLIGNSRYEPQTELNLLKLFRQRQLAGVIVAECTDNNRLELRKLNAAGIPTVLTWEIPSDPTVDCVGFDNFGAAYRMTEHLIEFGHSRIGLIAGRFSQVERARHRLEGYVAALSAHGLPLDYDLIVERAPAPIEGKLAMTAMLRSKKIPTAVFAASDALAIGALAAAQEAGIRVPADVSICGFDDLDFAAFVNPPLTTIRVPTYEMGRRAAELILRKIHRQEASVTRIELPTDLIVRGSTGRPG